MNKVLYSSPEVMCIEIMAGAILAGSNDPNTIPNLDLYDMDEE